MTNIENARSLPAPDPAGTGNSTSILDRRKFLSIASLSSAALALTPKLAEATTSFAATDPQSAQPAYAAFHSLAPGEIKPEGWLQLYLQKQARELAIHLPDVSWPFTVAYWAGEENRPDPQLASGVWWPWEQKAYWVDGALRCALVLDDKELLKKSGFALEYTLDHQSADGYLGPIYARDAEAGNPAAGNFRWPHTVFFRALAAYSEALKDERVAAAMRRHYLSDWSRVRYGGPSRDVTNVEAMLWAFQHTGDRQLLSMAEKAWNDFLLAAQPGDRRAGDLTPDRVFANTPIRSHGVTYAEKSKLPAIVYMYTGNPEYLRFALAAQDRIFNHHMLVDGMPSTSEEYAGTSALDAHETCDIVDHTWSWGYLLMATGDGIWADRIERACFNAGMGAIKKDWKAIQYFSSPNQVIATQTSNHVPDSDPDTTPWMAFAPDPGHESSCCGGNVHRLFPNYVIRMWMKDAKSGGLAAMLYGASTLSAEVGVNREPIEIRQETGYPFAEDIHFTISASKPVEFPLLMRIPDWCKAPRLALNGKSLAIPTVSKGFIRIERTFHPGDSIALTLPMQATLTYWPDNGMAIEHGPLVYAMAIKETWSPVVTPLWSTAAYPEWDANPASAWNYVFAEPDLKIVSQSDFQRRPMTQDPWVNPPVSITVAMKKIPGWTLKANPNHPEWLQTPPLPDVDQAMAMKLGKVESENIVLVPYGSTHLRLAIFANANPW